ncbi:glutathione S-transferase family protein [Thalassospira xianhensis]|nr:glutathione S-transferase N-terminal domain-containing protein [Thalassospira xianhensis]
MAPTMQLYYAPTSPFSRKVRIIARELGLEGKIAEIMIDPWTDAALREHNPLAKVPTLVLENGMSVFESAVICDYLDEVARANGRETGIIPHEGPERLNALQWQGLADGMMAATGRLFADSRRPENERSDFVMDRQHAAVQRSIDVIEGGIISLATDSPDIGILSVAVALEYVDFRWPDGRFVVSDDLRHWISELSDRPSMIATRYHLLPV